MTRLNEWITKAEKMISNLAVFTLLVMTIWIFLDVMLRFLFNTPITGTLEITGEYMLVILVYFSISMTYRENGHINVTFITNKFSKRTNNFLKALTNLLGVIIFILIAYLNFQQGIESLERDIRTVSPLKYPIGPAYIIISIGILLLSIRLLIESITILIGKNDKSLTP
jgi:TRAP-type transport system small permease protein